MRSRALADKAVLDVWVDVTASTEQAQQALAIARNVDDPALLARALAACGIACHAYDAEAAKPFFFEAMELARAQDDRWRLSQILFWQAGMAIIAGDPITARMTAEEGRDVADGIGDHFSSRCCRGDIGWASLKGGDVAGAVTQFRAVDTECEATNHHLLRPNVLQGLASALAYRGEATEALAAAGAAVEAGAELGEFFEGMGHSALMHASLAAGDVAGALVAADSAWRRMSVQPKSGAVQRAHNSAAALAAGDLAAARSWADEATSATAGWNLVAALTTRTTVSIAEGKLEEADRDAHEALPCAQGVGVNVAVPDIFECLAQLASDNGRHPEATRLCGAAEAMRQRIGAVRFKIYDAGHGSLVAILRNTLGDNAFDAAWAEGAALSTDEAIAYAQRGHGERKRPSSGWESLTPAELDVVRLVADGLSNKDVAARLFISPRTVQAHLAHVFAKLGVTSRMQLAQEAARHTST